MRLKSKRLVSLLLAGSMMVSMVPASAVTAFAAETKSVAVMTEDAKQDVPSDGHCEVTVRESGDTEGVITDKTTQSSVQKALEAAYNFSSTGDDRFDSVKSLTVKTEAGIVLTPADFQFIGGVKVNSVTSYNYAGGNPVIGSTVDTTYYWLRNLTEVDLTDANLKDDKFPDRAFCGNTKIEAVIFPSTLVSAGFKTFCYMNQLAYVGTKEGKSRNTIVFPETMTKIENASFFHDPSLSCKVELPERITYLGQGAFENTPIEGDIVLYKGTTLESDASYLFRGTKINSIKIEDGVAAIGQYAFEYDPNLYNDASTREINETIVIPESVTNVGVKAFYNTGSNVKNIIVGNENITFGANALGKLNAKIYLKKSIANSGEITTSSGTTTGYIWDNTATILNTDGGTIETDSNSNVTADLDENTGLYVPTKEGYKFLGWYTNVNDETTKLVGQPTAGTTYYAKWAPKEKYTVTFDLNGHGDNTTKTVYEDDTVTKPAGPTAKGYKFAGWYADEDCTVAFDFTKRITTNTTVYAKWEKIPDHQLTVTGGTFTVKDETVEIKTEDDKLIADVPEGAEVTVTFNKAAYADSNLVFGGWKIEGLDDADKYTGEEFTFTMPETGVTIEALTKTADTEDDSWDAATVVTGVAIGAGAAVLTYHIGTELYAEQVLGKGVAVPKTREEVALKAWELAGKPAVELNGEPLSETAQAEKWAVESGLMQNVDGSFNGAKKMNKLKALRVLDAAKKMNAQ